MNLHSDIQTPSPQGKWREIDRYLTGLLAPPDEVLDHALAASADAGLPAHEVTPLQGKLLHLLVRITHSHSVLEIGTLGAYSTIWLARALPESGRLVSLEVDRDYAKIASANLRRAHLSSRSQVLVGPAAESLASLIRKGRGPFDLIFIDADKQSNPVYLDAALSLSRPGTVIVADNVVRDGAIGDQSSDDPRVAGIRRFVELVASQPRLEATAIQTVGSKGYDGFLMAVVGGETP